jgi:hypothetical protein
MILYLRSFQTDVSPDTAILASAVSFTSLFGILRRAFSSHQEPFESQFAEEFFNHGLTFVGFGSPRDDLPSLGMERVPR